MVICAAISAILLDIFDIDKLTLTGTVEAGIPVPSVPQFTINHTVGNVTITKSTAEIFQVITTCMF